MGKLIGSEDGALFLKTTKRGLELVLKNRKKCKNFIGFKPLFSKKSLSALDFV
jgi:hypothetical protein